MWELSWRRFTVLVRGLPPDSAWALTSRARTGGPRRLTDPKAIESWFGSLATTRPKQAV